jgi:undecaprenyl-diphosphatase
VKAGLPRFLARRFDPGVRYGLRVTLFAIAVLVVMLPFSYLLVQVTSEGPLTETDTALAGSSNEEIRDTPPLIATARVLSFLGSPPWFYVIVGGSALWFWRRNDRRLALFLVVTNLTGGAVDTVVKVLVNRPRPDIEDPIAHAFGKSFPSGHAMSSTFAYGSLLLAYMPFIPERWRPRAIVGYIVLILLIAMSRLGLGVHFLSDVLGGIVLGVAWLIAGVAAFSIWRREVGKPPVEVLEGAEPEASH